MSVRRSRCSSGTDEQHDGKHDREQPAQEHERGVDRVPVDEHEAVHRSHCERSSAVPCDAASDSEPRSGPLCFVRGSGWVRSSRSALSASSPFWSDTAPGDSERRSRIELASLALELGDLGGLALDLAL
jgi:hypothetical protein